MKYCGASGDCRNFDWQRRLAEGFRQKCSSELRAHLPAEAYLSNVPLAQVLETSKCRLAANCIVQIEDMQARLDALERLLSGSEGQANVFIPIRFVPNQKIAQNDELVLAFDALLIDAASGCMPPYGRIVHGNKQATAKLKVSVLMPIVRAIVTRIAAQHASQTPPQLVLNRHCPECEFRTRCHRMAVEKDDLSLLSGMTEKERQRNHKKGIFTVTQLSYTFRPRRKPRRFAAKPDKYSHALRALAIRENKIYVAGRPELKVKGSPVYLDVEGVPDRGSYYLIGLRIKSSDTYKQHSFWADEESGEGEIWMSFLQTLAMIENPQLIYYGSYETQFLKLMKKRHADSDESRILIDRLIQESVNLLSVIYAQIYFPTCTNGLKEIAQYLGFQWSDSDPSGLAALSWRSEWESSSRCDRKDKLVIYNAEDCQALERVTDAVSLFCRQCSDAPRADDGNFVHTDSLKPDDLYRYSRKPFALPELKEINEPAYWDYQRERVYVRSNRRVGRAVKRLPEARSYLLPIDEVIEYPAAGRCPSCGSEEITRLKRWHKTIYDLKFSPGSVIRWVVSYSFHRYPCCQCGTKFFPRHRPWTGTRHGPNVVAYLMYQIIGLRLTYALAARNLRQIFGLRLQGSEVARQKEKVA